jgi:hypothetical protein
MFHVKLILSGLLDAPLLILFILVVEEVWNFGLQNETSLFENTHPCI